MIRRRVSLLILLFQLLTLQSYAIRFYLNPGQRRCFTEDLPTGQKINGETRVSGGKGDMRIDVWITTVEGRVLYHKYADDHGKFTFDTPKLPNHRENEWADDYEDSYIPEDDTYKVCIEHQQVAGRVHEPGTKRAVSIHFNEAMGMQSERQVSRAATSQSTDQLQSSMREIHNTLSAMIGDLAMLESRERFLTKRISGTIRQVTILAVVSLFVICLTSLLQFRYYKGYFQQKKLC